GIVRPAIGASFARTRHSVAPPELLAGFRIKSREIAADAEFRARDADDHHPVRHQRCARHDDAVFGIAAAYIPDFLAGLGVQRLNAPIQHGPDELAVVERTAAIDDAAAGHL